jgi:hypothetical protein
MTDLLMPCDSGDYLNSRTSIGMKMAGNEKVEQQNIQALKKHPHTQQEHIKLPTLPGLKQSPRELLLISQTHHRIKLQFGLLQKKKHLIL